MKAKIVYNKGKDKRTERVRSPILASRISILVNYPWIIHNLLGSRRNRP